MNYRCDGCGCTFKAQAARLRCPYCGNQRNLKQEESAEQLIDTL